MDQLPPSPTLQALLRQIYQIPTSEVKSSSPFTCLSRYCFDKTKLLSSIPSTSQPSHRPLHLLHLLLTELSGPWPTLPLIRCHTRLLQLVPESSKYDPSSDCALLIRATARCVKDSYSSLSDFIGNEPLPALRTPGSHEFITHQQLHRFVTKFHLPIETGLPRPVVAIALPNGPLLAATCVAVMASYKAAPINSAVGPEPFRADISQTGAKFILTTREDCEKLKLGESWVTEQGIEVLLIDWSPDGDITILNLANERLPPMQGEQQPNKADDIALILFTSGTSGMKKVVPLTIHSIISGVAFVVDSWGLTSTDICLNMMPLYHVGGLVRNILAPIFSGGSTICCPAFDPNLFWDVIEDIQPTWYYASPTMHNMILAEAKLRPEALKKSCIRLACNAAGGLLPSLAYQLRDAFKCVVLPSYGMTECMPISTPPLDYRLEREGTSGISAGPELAVFDSFDVLMPSGTVGRICVRGEPMFQGYLLPNGTLDKSSLNANGWFDTGDLGYMDDDGYLYITGRSKEVINRGGELISPAEVENAVISASMSTNSPISGRISQALAFSISHDVLQEVVGMVLVTPPSAPRVDLRVIHEALSSSLQQVKWPVMLIYMDGLPVKNNKIIRINLGERLGLPVMTDDVPYLERHWQAACPPADTALSVPIECFPCPILWSEISRCLDSVIPADIRYHFREHPVDSGVEIFLAPGFEEASTPTPELEAAIRQQISTTLPGYMIPSQIHIIQDPFPRDAWGNVDEGRLDQMLLESFEPLEESTIGKITTIFGDILAHAPSSILHDVDFFSLGGDSLRAGRLVSALRSEFHISVPISLVFNQGTVCDLAAYIDKLVETSSESLSTEKNSDFGCSETKSSTNPFLMLVQLIPLAVVYPMRRAFQWTAFVVALSYTESLSINGHVLGRLMRIVLSVSIAKTLTWCVAPFVGIAAKWLIIGRYREGLYPMWGLYHTRWWMVQKIVSICNMGVFDMGNASRCLYLRLMGAKVGNNVTLSEVALGEWDLLDFRDGVTLNSCICRAFAVERNTSMYLGKIVLNENCSVGVSSIIAAGTNLPANTCIGPNSSSWELQDADEANRDLSPNRAPQTHWLLTYLLTAPLSFIAWFLALLPWAAGLVGMALHRQKTTKSPLRDSLDWFTAADRVGYHYLALILRGFFNPFILFAFAVLVRVTLDAILGKQRPGSAKGRGAIATWRADVIKTVLPPPRLHDLTKMFGQHYEATSVALRMLGSKVGKRIYWPGLGPGITDYHLLDIGDDVVFGSRSYMITSDGIGSDKIVVEDGAMVADRVCLLPGVQVGQRTVIGSGAVTSRDKSYDADCTYIGSKGGDSICLSTGRHTLQGQSQSPSNTATLAEYRGSLEKQGAHTPPKQGSSDTLFGKFQRSSRPAQSQQEEATPAPSTNSSNSGKGDVDNEKTDVPPDMENISPFGRAFYLKLAPYHVLGPFAIFCYSSFLKLFTEFYWNVPNVSSVQLSSHIMNRILPRDTNMWFQITVLFFFTCVLVSILTTILAVLALAVVIASKWALLGRRVPGDYDWDKSSYCQRWNVFLTIEKLRVNCYQLQGILGLLTGTSWMVLYFRALGATIGKDCAIFANGLPSVMFTEPDLITLGDRVAIDDASVVAHINTRGNFKLNRLEIGDRCVLRTGSRLMSGAAMKADGFLMEHTLIMGGDVVEAGSVMQGFPAEDFTGKRVKDEHARNTL